MKVYLEVYGCTANKSDASLVKGVLERDNHIITHDINDADVLILLTCTVIGTTEQRMLSRLREFRKTGKKIIVSGCMASAQSDLINKIAPDAQTLPPRYIYQIADLIKGKDISFEDKNKTVFPKIYDNAIAPISISEGCIFSCSYCITSVARGKLKSYPIEEIRENIESAVRDGCREIQLTAQDTASYGMDTGCSIGGLLKEVSNIEGDFRIRLGMMNPYTAFKNINSIIEAYNNPKIYKFLHLPVQSGDNVILKKMNRLYTVEEFIELVKKVRMQYPDITISTDVIVGFPTETDAQFQHTIDLIKNISPDITNITRYSARPYTKAKKMKGRIKTEIVKERSRILTSICRNISKENNKKHIGKKYSVLITEKGTGNTMVGRTENYKPVVLREDLTVGEFLPVEITDSGTTYLVGSMY